ncbi:hypothetical protein [Micrococcus lylae]|uniref:hypothetical protein n=1 Tax=Micrococcus lylae TaxID=1273 RepID=UPI000C80DE3B|nr:hypothetical protein [Micrococcus lylae]WIK82145.1 hypothetical protein CJ228_011255 [Micrococcus lylae]
MKRLYNAVCAWLEADAKARAAEDDEPPYVDEGNSTALADAPDHHRPGLHADHPRTQDQLFDETDLRHRIGFTTARPPTTGRSPRCPG